MSVAIIGGGVAGLAAAYRLTTLGRSVTVYEAGPRVGGVVRTEQRDGFLAEAGPNSLASPEPEVRALLEEVGLAARQVEAAPAARKRYIVRAGRLVALPASPAEVLTTRAFSLKGKLAILREPFVSAAAPSAQESVAEFVRRRLGGEFLDYAAAPFVGGIYAGDPAALSVRNALPRLHALEREHGSILRGALARRRALRAAGTSMAGGPGRIVSFPAGMGEIPEALAGRLADRIRTSCAVQGVRRVGGGWTVRAGGDDSRHDAVILACPAHAFASLAVETAGNFRPAGLADIPYAPVAVVVLGFRREDVDHPLDGFGVLVPAVERRQVLGVLFSSTLFPGRAPAGCITLTTFVGGARQPALAALDPDALVRLVRRELEELLGARGELRFRQVVRWPRAIPQYVLGYDRWLGLMDQIEATNPGLFLAGSYRRGVALPDALRSGLDVATRAAEAG